MKQETKDIITGIWKVMLNVMSLAYSIAIMWSVKALTTIIINSIFHWEEVVILGNRTVIGTAVGFIDIILFYACLKFTYKKLVKSRKTRILWWVILAAGLLIGQLTYPYLSQVVQ